MIWKYMEYGCCISCPFVCSNYANGFLPSVCRDKTRWNFPWSASWQSWHVVRFTSRSLGPASGKGRMGLSDLIDFSPEKLTWHLEYTGWKSSFPFLKWPLFKRGHGPVFLRVLNVNEWWFQKIRSLKLLTVSPLKMGRAPRGSFIFQLLIFRRAKILDSGRVGVVELPVVFNRYDSFSVLMGHSCSCLRYCFIILLHCLEVLALVPRGLLELLIVHTSHCQCGINRQIFGRITLVVVWLWA